MANERKATVTYVGDGVQKNYAFSFDYLQKNFIKVHLIGLNTVTELSYGVDYVVTDKQVTFFSAPVGTFQIYRETPTERLVSWEDASVLRAADMTLQEIQLLHTAEETMDKVQDTVLTKDENDGKWDARLSPIKNVLDPTDPTDAMNLRVFNTLANGFIATNQTLVNQAAFQKDVATEKASESNTSAIASKTSETNAKTSETNVKSSEVSTKTSETNAKASETNAKTSETNAKASETNAKTSENNAKTSEVLSLSRANAASFSESNAKTSETNAKTSETNAKISETNAKASEILSANNATSASTSAASAASSAASAFGATAPAYNPGTSYSFPQVVAFTDGYTYRCTGTNIVGQSPDTSVNWVRITIPYGDFFESDVNGDIMPSMNPKYSEVFQLDADGDITLQ